MKTVVKKSTKWMTAIAIAPFGLFLGAIPEARAAEPACCQNCPMIKNLMAPTYRCAPAAVHQEHSRTEVKRLTATAESVEDHFKLADYYKAEAERLDAQAAGYEEAAAAYRHGPIVKNLIAPNTPARYEVVALASLFAATSFAQDKAKKSYTFHGKVEAVTAKGLTVNGEKVEGWMDAMTMTYPVDKPDVLKKVKVGDQIMATVYQGDMMLHSVEVMPPDKSGKQKSK